MVFCDVVLYDMMMYAIMVSCGGVRLVLSYNMVSCAVECDRMGFGAVFHCPSFSN